MRARRHERGQPDRPAAAHNPDVFYRLFGDATGGGRVNSLDYNLMLNDYGLRSGDAGFNACLDFNADGVIDDTDYRAKKRGRL